MQSKMSARQKRQVIEPRKPWKMLERTTVKNYTRCDYTSIQKKRNKRTGDETSMFLFAAQSLKQHRRWFGWYNKSSINNQTAEQEMMEVMTVNACLACMSIYGSRLGRPTTVIRSLFVCLYHTTSETEIFMQPLQQPKKSEEIWRTLSTWILRNGAMEESKDRGMMMMNACWSKLRGHTTFMTLIQNTVYDDGSGGIGNCASRWVYEG